MILHLLSAICVLSFSQWLFAEPVGAVEDSSAQKVKACQYNQESTDKASSWQVNPSRHLGSLGFHMEEETKKLAPAPNRRGSGSVK